ncbi:MAG: 16S rRNA (guanine(966)-N(2))-methyltransferase RsmD [Pseudomonadota bacterium]
MKRNRPSAVGTPHRVRIIGGAWKRTPIPVANEPGLRPTPDRVRETLFNWIAHLRPDLEALRGLDLFAGTGALGFELASRGAAHVTLVERDPKLAARLRALRDKLGATRIDIAVGDALATVSRLADQSFDLVFIDPPYDSGLLVPALEAVRRLLAPDGLVYAESDAPIDAAQAAAHGYELVRADRAGRVCFHLLRRRSS